MLRSAVVVCLFAAIAGPLAAAGRAPPLVVPKPAVPPLAAPARASAVERVLTQSGLDVDALIARMDSALSSGQGGPLVARFPAKRAGRKIGSELERQQRVRKLLTIVPLAAPMGTFRLTSGFGYRRDPITRRTAAHTGQDFGGPRNAPVLATAPGKVVESGRAGAYGILVTIDHGMGIRTRYAHLRRAIVRVGQKVRVGQQIGNMGNTGRSTGAHLHYEVRVDGEPLDPAKFLTAGGRLQRLVGTGGLQPVVQAERRSSSTAESTRPMLSGGSGRANR